MSCCTLKRPRPADLDSLLSPLSGLTVAAKRSRGLPITSKFNRRNTLPAIPLQVQQEQQKLVFSPTPFSTANIPPVTQDMIATALREEMKRFQKRRQLQHGTGFTGTIGIENDSSCGDGIRSNSSPTTGIIEFGGVTPTSTPGKDKPLFTFDQVGRICQRMLDEREKELREEYGKILVTKLDEQYDTFVKFTQDQIRSHFQCTATNGSPDGTGVPSYLS